MKTGTAILIGLVLLALFVGGGGYGLNRFGLMTFKMFPTNVNPCEWSLEVVDNGQVVRYCPPDGA